MYYTDSHLKRPRNSLQPLWRYMKYEHLLDLLSTECLYFRQHSKMRDKWEGLLTEKANDRLFKFFYAQYHDVNKARGSVKDNEMFREDFYISCWHMNDHESYLMWKVYADRGCAIQTTFERIQIAFEQFTGEVTGGVVEYVDFRLSEIPVGNLFDRVGKKDLPYKDEREFRLVFWKPSLRNQAIPVGIDGVKIKVDLNKLIENIWLSPQFKESASGIYKLAEEKRLECYIHSSAVSETSEYPASQSG